MAKGITLKTKNGTKAYPKSVTDLIFDNATGKTLKTLIEELKAADSATDTRTQYYKASVTDLDALNAAANIGTYNYVGNGWRGLVQVCLDHSSNVAQVALSSSSPSYDGNVLLWLAAQPCAMARVYRNGAWSHWEKVGAPVVNDLTTGGTDKALSAEMGKTLKEGLDALGPKIVEVKEETEAKFQERIPLTNENGWFVIDPQGNVGMQLVNGLLDALGFGANLIAKIKEAITSNTDLIEELNAGTMNAMSVCAKAIKLLNEDGDVIADITPKLTKEDGVYFTDSEGNIMWYIKAYTTAEGGIYFIDENGWIGCQYVDGVWSFSNLSNAGGGSSVSTDHAIIVRANKTLKEARELNDKVNGIVPSLLTITDGSVQTTKTTTISNSTAKKKAVVRMRLHYGAEKYTPDASDIFFNGSCKTDFSDVRFFDGNGKMLKAKFGEPFNMGVYRDTNVAGNLYVTSQGYLVKYDSGIKVSTNNGSTWTLIANTTNVTEHGSDVYNRKSIYPVFVDSLNNIFGYAGGKLYKVVTDFTTLDGSNNVVATITEVLDFSWNYNGTTIYPDVQADAMAEDINGNLYIGCYQSTQYYHVDVFVSTDGGNNWTKKYNYYDQSSQNQQHVHHIHADKYSSMVYVGIDGGLSAQGPTVIVTDDAGATWTDITTQLKAQRGHDYYPTYFGSDYKLGGGEVYTLGGNAIVRGNSSDDALDIVYKGYGGVRNFADFGNDDVIVAGVSRNSKFSENQLVVSFDTGKTWHTLFRKDVPNDTSGDGFRRAVSGTFAGDTGHCIILNEGSYVSPYRVYNGGDYYREAEVELEDVSASNITIVAKTGFVIPYPYTTVRGIEDESLVYEIPFDEGCGKLVQDSLGNLAQIEGTVEWETNEEPQRFGEYSSENDKPFRFSSAAKITGQLNFGKIPSLNFASGYTITFWLNERNRLCNYTDADKLSHEYLLDGVAHIIASIGGCELIHYNNTLCFIPRGSTATTGNSNGKSTGTQALQCSDNYTFVAIVIGSNRVLPYLNGCASNGGNVGSWVGYTNTNISAEDLTIGCKDTDAAGYISGFRIYNKELSADEIRDIYKGFNY